MASPASSSCIVVLNRSSGWTDKLEEREQLLRILGPGKTSIILIEKGANVPQIVRGAMAGGCKTVVAGGGDGTIRAAAEAVVGTEAMLGILPVGTINHFARDLRIPLNIERAARSIVQGKVERVDVGEVNGRVFINNVILGLYPIYRFERDEQERRGWRSSLAVIRAALAVFRRYPFLTVRFQAEGKELVRRTLFVLIANNEHQLQGYRLGTRARLNEGRLWVYILRPRGRLEFLSMSLRLLAGRFHRERDMEFFSAREVRVETHRRRIGLSLDGEITVLETPLQFRSRPRALQVIVPPEPQTAR